MIQIMQFILTLCLSSLLISCFAPTHQANQLTESASLSSSTATSDAFTSYKGSFKYTFNQCSGDLAKVLESLALKPQAVTIHIKEDRIQLSRPDLQNVGEREVLVNSGWNSSNGQLSLARGYLGISDQEQWTSASGELTVLEGQTSGILSEVMIHYKNSTICKMSVSFDGKKSN